MNCHSFLAQEDTACVYIVAGTLAFGYVTLPIGVLHLTLSTEAANDNCAARPW